MHAGGIGWNDLNPFNYEACIGDYCTDLDTIGETLTDGAVTVGNAAVSAGEVISDSAKTVYDFYAEDPVRLPIIVFGWPLMLFGAGCSTKRTTTTDTAETTRNITLGFTEADNPMAYQLYQGLLREGVAQSQIDSGYNVANYAGTQCPVQQDKTCTKGASDFTIEPQEVFEYISNNYQRFQPQLEKTTGRSLPWVLDDLNPKTTFDEQVRSKVAGAINLLKQILSEQGLRENTETYNELLALGLYFLVATPGTAVIDRYPAFFQKQAEELKKAGLERFMDYIRQNGNLRFEEWQDHVEYTALEALQNNKGSCTEISKILFAVFKMAGLDPQFLIIKFKAADMNSMYLEGEMRVNLRTFTLQQPGFNHAAVGLQFGNRFRIFDASFFQSNANYSQYFPVKLRQFLSYELSNDVNYYTQDGNKDHEAVIKSLSISIQVDPMNPLAYYNRGFSLSALGQQEPAIADYTMALSIYPLYEQAYYQRGLALLQVGRSGEAIQDFTNYLKLIPTHISDISDVSREIFRSLRKKWVGTPEKTIFSGDTPYDIAQVEAFFIKVSILWNLGQKFEARTAIRQSAFISSGFTLKRNPSNFTKQFFETIFNNMPVDMREDPNVKEVIDLIKNSLRNTNQ